MLKSLITREILDHMLSLRFIVGLILCSVVTVTCVVILTHDYRQELKDYNQRIAMQDDFLNNYAHTNRLGGMMLAQKPPETFRPLIIGVQKDADLGSFDDNPLPVLFPLGSGVHRHHHPEPHGHPLLLRRRMRRTGKRHPKTDVVQ